MENCNAIIRLYPHRLNLPLATIYAGRLAETPIKLHGIPDDVTAVMLTVGIPGTTDTLVVRGLPRPGGEWMVIIPVAALTVPGDSSYYVTATSASGNPVALGQGRIKVIEFAISEGEGTPIVHHTTTVLDANGNAHNLIAVLDAETNEWTLQLGD